MPIEAGLPCQPAVPLLAIAGTLPAIKAVRAVSGRDRNFLAKSYPLVTRRAGIEGDVGMI